MSILKALMHREVKDTGRKCELCHCQESEQSKLWEYFIDYDPTNHTPENIIILCPPCYRMFTTANPDGISTKNGIFAFAINRGLYDWKKEREDTGTSPSDFLESARRHVNAPYYRKRRKVKPKQKMWRPHRSRR